MLIQGNATLKIGLFKKAYMFETDRVGIVIENDGHVVCIYGTDKNHSNIYCAIPLCPPKYVRKDPFSIKEKGNVILIQCQLFKVMIDFEAKKCSCTDPKIALDGSDEWGKDVSVAWDDSFDS